MKKLFVIPFVVLLLFSCSKHVNNQTEPIVTNESSPFSNGLMNSQKEVKLTKPESEFVDIYYLYALFDSNTKYCPEKESREATIDLLFSQSYFDYTNNVENAPKKDYITARKLTVCFINDKTESEFIFNIDNEHIFVETENDQYLVGDLSTSFLTKLDDLLSKYVLLKFEYLNRVSKPDYDSVSVQYLDGFFDSNSKRSTKEIEEKTVDLLFSQPYLDQNKVKFEKDVQSAKIFYVIFDSDSTLRNYRFSVYGSYILVNINLDKNICYIC